MNKDEYIKLVNKGNKEKNAIRNAVVSFLSGGILGSTFHVLALIIIKNFDVPDTFASGIVLFIYILAAIILTGCGIFDKLASKYRFGLIIPITGFANSVASSLLEYRRDGLITGLGANMFKLAGPVILYGSVSGLTFAFLKVIING